MQQNKPHQPYEYLYCGKDVAELFTGRALTWAREHLAEVRQHHKIKKGMPVPAVLFARYYGYSEDYLNERLAQLRHRK